jgi:branched-chain amino acid transport system ATP-binding protein
MTSPVTLNVSNVSTGYGNTQLLWNVSAVVEPGVVVALLGPNGAGKTTLMRAVTGLNRVWSGHIRLGREDLTSMPCHRRVAAGLGMVPAGRRLFLGLNVEENLRMGAFLLKDRKEVARRIQGIFEMFPRLSERRHTRVSDLSGGEQQMCAIGRGLISSPRYLLVDELSMGLAPTITSELLETLTNFSREHKVGVVLVEQDVRAALRAADYAYVLEEGKVVLEGETSGLIDSDDLARIFVGAT